MLMWRGCDCLLKEVTTHLNHLLDYRISDAGLWPRERIALLHGRSKDVQQEFAKFFCLRLLLDQESPLATYFIDLFCELEWLLKEMLWICELTVTDKPSTVCRSAQKRQPMISDTLIQRVDGLLYTIEPAINTCRSLYAFARFSPTACSRWLSSKTEFKREGKPHRDFSTNQFHCLTRTLGFVNLDRQGHVRVELGEELGSGSFGKVYRGQFQTLGRAIGDPVAVKVFQDGGLTGSAFGSQWYQSMEHMMELQHSDSSSMAPQTLSNELWGLVCARHPNIVRARGYIGKRAEGESGLVMELMDGSLQELLEEVSTGVRQPLEELQVLDLMLEIAKGMRFLHECNLMHRDLKPQNVLLRGHGSQLLEVKLADFGLMKPSFFGAQEPGMQSIPLHTSPVGTPCYMAPELRVRMADDQAPYEDKVDVFSYGTTCFNILTCDILGALEFTQPCHKDEFYEAVKRGEWRQGVENKPVYLVDLVARCWELDPSQRPTFATICSLLQRAMQDILAPPDTNVSTLTNIQQNCEVNLLNLFWSIMQSAVLHPVIRIEIMESCLQGLVNEVTELGRLLDANPFLEMLKQSPFLEMLMQSSCIINAPETTQELPPTNMGSSAGLLIKIAEAGHSACKLQGEITGSSVLATGPTIIQIGDVRQDDALCPWNALLEKLQPHSLIIFKALICSYLTDWPQIPLLDYQSWIWHMLKVVWSLKKGALPRLHRSQHYFPIVEDAAKSKA